MPESVAYWLPYVQAFEEAYHFGERLSDGHNFRPPLKRCSSAPPLLPSRPQNSLVICCSPHPDDEVLTGILPLRLLQEQGARVINLAVTLGSNAARQAERWSELLDAGAQLGFDCQQLKQPLAIDPQLGETGDGWLSVVTGLVDFFVQQQPALVMFPHPHDAHPTHIATNRLVCAALARWTSSCQVTVRAVETEYWSSMSDPNLLIGVSSEDVARLLAALSCHRGEISRNPYHLTYPARLMDAVRRGSELVPSTLQRQPGFIFGELYRLSIWRHGHDQTITLRNALLGPSQGLNNILADIA